MKGASTTLKWLPVPLAAAFYVDFIARTKVRLGGHSAYVLADDAMISMTYARHFAEGGGLVWGDGRRVEGYSNLLWTLWMALLHLFGMSEFNVSLAVMITSAVLLLVTVVVTGRIVAELAPGRPAIEAAAMLLTGLFYPLAYWALRGMEVGLVALLISLMALLALRLSKRFERRWAWALAATMCAGLLTRDEMIIPCVLTGAFLLWAGPREHRRPIAAYLGGAVLVTFTGHLIFRVAYYGDALPNTYYLKLAHVALATRLHRGFESAAHTWIVTLYAPLLMAGAYFLARRHSVSRGALLIAALFLAQTAYSTYVGGDYGEELLYANRYVAPAAPLLMALAAIGIGDLLGQANRRVVRLGVAAAFLVAAGLVAFDWLPTKALGVASGGGIDVRRAAIAVAIGATVAAAPLFASLGARWAALGYGLGLLLLASIVLLQVDDQPVREWARVNAAGLDRDAGYARYGVIIRAHTSPGTAVAAAAVGNVAYFSRRPVVDLLGKVDPVIARERNRQVGGFKPGHSKWDYAYSIGRRRPPVLAEVYAATATDLCNIARWGYRQVAPFFFVEAGARGVDVAALGPEVTRTHFNPPAPALVGCRRPPS